MPSSLYTALVGGFQTLETLGRAPYFLKVSRHRQMPNLVQLKYDQIQSDMSLAICQEARGIILDEADGWRIVAQPFNKFFNAGEPLAADLDWDSARVLEKLDGSLMILYYYRDRWEVASSGRPDAGGNVNGRQMTFRQLFWETWKQYGYDLDDLDPNLTYMFELMTPENRVVVPHEHRRLVLIGVRDPRTGEEQHLEDYEHGRYFDIVQEFFDIDALEDLQQSFESIDGLQQEGYVVVDRHFRRLKVKHPRYVAFHQMVGSLTPKRVLDAVRRGETPEVLTYFPNWKQEFETVTAKYETFVAGVEATYEMLKDIQPQKGFAHQAIIYPYSGALFQVRSGKAKSFREFFKDLSLDKLADMVGVSNAEED